eukprot:TRINITY_DN3806_c0_g1_i9.p4 TRINITY_DN3806_c0_g1~~TRINITY_DN3806_c0_g1_i9.p4  ORF type:complete len:112 (+),score=4.09 TRINITY_DN3806_c0_g1_i9:651-986(+)
MFLLKNTWNGNFEVFQYFCLRLSISSQKQVATSLVYVDVLQYGWLQYFTIGELLCSIRLVLKEKCGDDSTKKFVRGETLLQLVRFSRALLQSALSFSLLTIHNDVVGEVLW